MADNKKDNTCILFCKIKQKQRFSASRNVKLTLNLWWVEIELDMALSLITQVQNLDWAYSVRKHTSTVKAILKPMKTAVISCAFTCTRESGGA